MGGEDPCGVGVTLKLRSWSWRLTVRYIGKMVALWIAGNATESAVVAGSMD